MSEKIHIAIDNKSHQRWRFRIDDIGLFGYINKENIYENHSFFKYILIKLLEVIKDPTINLFLKEFIIMADDLKHKQQHDFFKVLINMVESKLVNSDIENEAILID